MQAAYEIYQRVLMVAGLAMLAALLVGTVLYAIRAQVSMILRWVRMNPLASILLAPAVLTLWVYGSTKPSPVTPTVKGITLGSPCEIPTGVSLAWTGDDDYEIGTNQLVSVWCRDADAPTWVKVAEGLGMTNCFVQGFFINRDTDWQVLVEGTNTVQGAGE